jgi:sensor histidine kinase YesM
MRKRCGNLDSLAVGPAAFLLVVMLIARDADARSALDRERIHMLELDRGLAEARLKVTQAQIEPHFLFNTLANIRRLFEVEPASGRAMLQHFEAMLASTLPTMRDARSTLAQEIAYARAYLSVQQIRMGDRLRFGFDVPDELLGRDFPPMMLLTLVENAIKHGIGPLPQGGTIRVEAARERDVLRVRVIDSGRGLSPSSGSGVGLANIEARLRADPTGRGRLVLEQNAVGGVSATIDVALAP